MELRRHDKEYKRNFGGETCSGTHETDEKVTFKTNLWETDCEYGRPITLAQNRINRWSAIPTLLLQCQFSALCDLRFTQRS